MSTKRQPSKQRRQTQNQRQRAALEARRANAATGSVPDGKVGGGSGSSESSGAGSSGLGSVFSRLRNTFSPDGAGSRAGADGGPPVGYRAALAALLAGVAGAIVGALLIMVPVDVDGEPVASAGTVSGEWTLSAWNAFENDPSATADDLVASIDDWMPNGEERYAVAYFPLSLTLLLPIVGAGLAFRSVTRRAPAKVVNRAVYVTLFGTLLSQQLPIFLPTVAGVIIAAFQVRKAEVAAGVAAAAAADAVGDDGGVIDVEEVDASDDVVDDRADQEEDFIEVEEIEEPEPEPDAAGAPVPGPPLTGLARLRRPAAAGEVADAADEDDQRSV